MRACANWRLPRATERSGAEHDATPESSAGGSFLFRQLTEDLTYFTHGFDLDEDSRARFAARGIRIIDTPVTEVVNDEDGALAGVRLADGQVGPEDPSIPQDLRGLVAFVL
jgi:hypothetical protein